jgi:hypothetical protein
MHNTVFFLTIFLGSSCALIFTPWVWPNQVTATHRRLVASAAPSPDQGSPVAPPFAASPASAKVAATISHSVHNVPRGLEYTSAQPSREETVAFSIPNRYRPHWVIEW